MAHLPSPTPSRRPAQRSGRSARRRSSSAVGLVAVLALTGGLTACGSDSSSDAATTTAVGDSSTTTASTTTTTSPGTLATVSDVWAPPAVAGDNAKVYLSITGGATADQLVGVSVAADWADSAALVPDTPVDLPATTTVDLTKDGTYIELTGLKKALEINKPFEVTLEFADAASQTVQGAVREVDEGTT